MSVQVEHEIQFNEELHEYRVDGVVMPSVTKILAASGLADFSAIPDRIRNFVLMRGKAAHRAGHYLLEGDLDEASVDPLIAGYVDALKSFLFHSGFNPLPGMIERRVHNGAHHYCGTYDAVGKLPALNGQLAIVDWKTGMMSGVEYQLAAYLLCIPNVYHRASVKLNKDGTFSVKPYSVMRLRDDQARFIGELTQLRRTGWQG